MTPAITSLKRLRLPYTIHRYQHDPSHPSYGLEAAEKLGLQSERVFKTLIVELDHGELVAAVIPVDRKLDLKSFAKVCGAKKAAMAEAKLVEKTTGYVLGGVSPLGQKKQLRTFLAGSAAGQGSIFISGGRRGLDLELSPEILLQATRGSYF